MSTHKLVTPDLTNKSKRAHGAKHIVVYLITLMDYHLLSHWGNLFLHGKVPLHKILLCCLSYNSDRSWPLLFHIFFFILTFTRQGLAWNAVFTNCFCLWNISCLIFLWWLCQRHCKINYSSYLPQKERTSYWEVIGNSARAPWNMVIILLLSVGHKLLFYFKQPNILQYLVILQYDWYILP